MRKPAFCICENKDADQLRGNREADQHLCFRWIDSTIHLLPKRKFKLLAILCGCTARFVWDLVENPEDRFSHNEAHLLGVLSLCLLQIQSTGKLCGYQRIGRFTSKSNMLKYEYKVLPSRRYHGGFNVSYIQEKGMIKYLIFFGALGLAYIALEYCQRYQLLIIA